MSKTTLLFRDDPYARTAEATVVGIDDNGGIVLDRTIFYAQGGGQPGDVGWITLPDGGEIAIANAVYGPDRSTVAHIPAAAGRLPAVGDTVGLRLDWAVRHARMRVHTGLHLLSVVLPFPVTGGAIGNGEGRLDFDIPDAGLDKDEISARLNDMITKDAPGRERWIPDEELLANPGLVKTMSVKPPMGTGRVRLVEIEGLDLQPCGGTHVRSTGEIGPVAVTAIEKKGRQNRRVRIALV